MSKAEIRKAAVLLASLPEPDAERLLAGLDPRQVEAVAAEIARLETVTADEQQSVMRELTAIGFPSAGGHAVDSRIYGTENVHGKFVATSRAKSLTNDSFAFLQHVDCQSLLGFLIDERPQTIALIASHVPSAYGAAIISGLPEERQLAVMRAVASMQPTDRAVVRDVAQALALRLRELAA